MGIVSKCSPCEKNKMITKLELENYSEKKKMTFFAR